MSTSRFASRPFFLSVFFSLLAAMIPMKSYAAVTPTIALNISAGEVTAGAAVTLTATLSGSSGQPNAGQVMFCEQLGTFCQNYAAGTVQMQASGKAVLTLTPSPGIHSYKAVLLANKYYNRVESSTQNLTVKASLATTVQAAGSGAGPYALQGTLSSGGRSLPTGAISFTDTTSGVTLGNGTLSAGTLSASLRANSSPAVGNETFAVQTADFNNDGRMDFAVLDTDFLIFTGKGDVKVYLNKGDGTFDVVTITVDTGNWLTVGDFNNDGKTDLAVVYSDKVSVIPGNGDGTFAAPTAPTATGPGAGPTIAADLDRDGNLDLVVIDNNGLTILLGKGDGTFTGRSVAKSALGGNAPYTVTAGDYTGDSIPDLVVQTQLIIGSSVSNFTYLLTGAGDGNFTIGPIAYEPSGYSYINVIAGDFNNDGKLDFIANDQAPGEVVSGYPTYVNGFRVVFGHGDGTFTTGPIVLMPPNSSLSGGYIENIAVADVDGDGRSDFFSVDSRATRLHISKGDGTFDDYTVAQGDDSVPNELTMASADFNGDGIPDVVRVDSDRRDAAVTLTSISRSMTYGLSGVTLTGSGSHTVSANYAGDAAYVAGSGTVSLTAQPAATTLSLTATPASVNAGAQVVLQATLTPYNSGTLTTNGENVTFFNGSTSLGTAPLGTGVATLNITSLPVGTSTITATYAGDANFKASTAAGATVTVAALPAVTLSPTSLAFGTLASGVRSASQTVTVTNSGQGVLAITSIAASGDFAQTNTCSGTVAPGASCAISVTFTPTQAGTRTGALTLVDNAASSPQTVTLTGTGAPVTITAATSSLSISRGGSGTSVLQLTGAPGFSGTVALTCSVAFQGTGTANATPTCSLIPSSVTLTSGGTGSSTLTVTTTAGSAAMQFPNLGRTGGVAVAGLLLLWVMPKRRMLRGAVLTVFAGLMLAGLSGCGGSSSPSTTTTPTTPGTTSGNYQVTVTATANSVTTTSTVAVSVP